jgi:hypothetical protein
MSSDDYTHCLKVQYNLDEEAVRFILHILDLGSQDAIKWLKDNWAIIAGASALITAIAKYGGQSAVVKFLPPILERAGLGVAGALIDVLVAIILGLGLAAVLLAIEAGVECLPQLDT